MTESENHKKLKLLGRVLLKDKGYLDEEIFEEYKIKLGKKNYRVDLCGIKNPKHLDGGESIAVECGITNSEKLVNLKLFFDEVIALPHGIITLDSDLDTILQEQSTKIQNLEKEKEEMRKTIMEKNQRIKYLESERHRYDRIMIIAEVLSRESEGTYPQSRIDQKINSITAILRDQTLEELTDEKNQLSTPNISSRKW